MAKRLLFVAITLLGFTLSAIAQDLYCRVSVVHPQIQTSDERIFKALEKQIQDFLNNRKWAIDNIQPQEKIEASITLNVSNWDGNSKFEATAQIQSSRPVFGASYNTPVLNINDKDWNFNYQEMQSLEYNESGNNNSNLALLLTYYANVIVGLDYDTFALEGGTSYFNKAQNVVNNAQNSIYAGWKAFESNKNRYWLAENLLNNTFKPVRDMSYTYHRRGLDLFYSNIDKGRTDLLTSLTTIERAYNERPTGYFFIVFFTAKSDEIANILQKADPTQRLKVLPILKTIDPANSNKYEQVAAAK
ncbi:type IX secretion system protein PorD [Solitalea koreensis]|uniref:DUF4835 domain-containing protein n=1 Tax=Solitalea koreensis TaxID=543615 RepID=A0A521EKM0_9SPHI|nr:DUF4835 family protein [Solitalea koreensis]SMO83690.1 protein of unknown function [Solitalea koreensis]